MASATQLTTLLDNDLLARVERLRLLSGRRFTNRGRGEHRARRGGNSLEFKDFRDYAAGDDIRFLDWGLFARLGRPYTRLYHDEEELCVTVLIDGSASMAAGGKLRLAQQLAAGLGVMALTGGERAHGYVFDARDGGLRQLRLTPGRRSMMRWFAFFEQVEAGGALPIERGLDAMLRVHRGRGLLIVLSDFLTAGELRPSFNRAHGLGLEVSGLQILAPDELNPELGHDVRLVDSETGAVLDVTATESLLDLYHGHRAALQRQIESLCRQRGGRYACLDASTPVEHALLDTLRRRGWLS